MSGRLRYLGKRLVLSLPVIWLGMSVTWFIIFMGPVDPAANVLNAADPQASEQYQRAQERLGLNEPPLQHYLDWMGNMLTFDFGQTWLLYPGSDVTALLFDFMPRTVWLGFWSVLIAIFVGIPLGFYAGLNSNQLSDYLTSMSGIVWRAMPNFWLAVMILSVLIFSESLLGVNWQTLGVGIDAVTGNPQLSYMAGDPLALVTEPTETVAAIKKILPAAVVLGSASMGNEMRIGRTAVLETKHEQYVAAARARGVPGYRIVWKHVLRNALVPLVPVITSEAFLLIGGSVLVETVFGIQGIGFLFFKSAIQGDLPLVGTLMFVFIVMIVGINLIQDVLYTIINPQVGYEEA